MAERSQNYFQTHINFTKTLYFDSNFTEVSPLNEPMVGYFNEAYIAVA